MKRGTVRWKEGSHYVGANDLGLEVPFQGPPREGERRVAPSPKDLVLLGLGGCTAVDVVEILHKMRQPLGALTVDLEAEESAEHPKVFTRVRLVYRLEGHGLDPERAVRAVTLSQQKYCGVSAMIGRTAAIHYAVEVNGQRVHEGTAGEAVPTADGGV
ncbi:MAG: osmotically inducible protein OsmC [Bacillota bacterium]|nr:MAG: osmotically inducible protein OsmC [Bacillota bacterium]